jgi:hypothetical protein
MPSQASRTSVIGCSGSPTRCSAVSQTPRTSSRTCGCAGSDRVGFLVTVTTRVALNAVTSAGARREVSVGEWLPKHDAAALDPQLCAERGEELAVALRLLLERLPPTERAVHVLREAFDYPFREIGEALGMSEANTRRWRAERASTSPDNGGNRSIPTSTRSCSKRSSTRHEPGT